MSQRLTRQQLQGLATVTAVPARHKVDRSFGLPAGFYIATVALYLAFIAVMAATFMNPELAIPMAIFAGFVVLAFGLAGYWVKMQPHNDAAAPSWSELASRGIDTLNGRLTANQAAVQVLTLPVLILCWGLAIAVIVAFT
ncbi:hypothetical protein [Novosphingobium guangzhouense]|uniref:Uncharacterized protein n=1 Tax=Novosphingobium guangzhouense TaxID=1850347 RepID=A0A2K2G112_9SPHN|nr:hypothetical protein [Novosphingobium guangzhouense]PNU04684.1 hypothetical protein A8V01_18975 [Novosphingobium guangzhouense]